MIIENYVSALIDRGTLILLRNFSEIISNNILSTIYIIKSTKFYSEVQFQSKLVTSFSSLGLIK
jgi:hypothetical protein